MREFTKDGAVWNHCFVYHEALASRDIPQDLMKVLKNAIKAVNLTKGGSLNKKLLKHFVQKLELIIPT
jgi:hypothetical protein